jgi:hypothetical protein
MDFKNLKQHYSTKLWPEFLFACTGLALLVRLYRLCAFTASDFEVYWYAVHAWVDGKSPYGLYSNVYNGLVYKYPPWSLAFFLPFAGLGMEISKVIWLSLQVLAIAYSARWLILCGIHRRIVFAMTLTFWWMWLAHAYFGQVMVFILASALAFGGAVSPKKRVTFGSETRAAFLGVIFSTKIFSVVSLIPIWKHIFRWRTIMLGLVVLAIAHLLILLTYPLDRIGYSGAGMIDLIVGLYRDWAHAAASGGAELGEEIVRGQQNHGLPAAILRNFHIGATQVGADVGIAVVLAAILGGIWYQASRKLKWEEQWAGWLALGTIVHPLAWHHSFIMAFPLCTFSIARAIDARKWGWIALSVLGIACICLFIPQVIGTDAVKPIERLGNKSWGVIFCAWVLVKSSGQKFR